ncbi:uncharacterized protein K452DRAFT_286275 [Aplosporella prunicola CBS 121167]|uniref:Zn(2)-C6 fungal-type domain-containing protein n=1 Tax=Aplosporella prunicola CBS 121167 TaxID=1176127 RepID=A0A6A6BH41_9PEZI|nr:uncharacterized protein K452DRAFT_286275 [Aplosporella prunicola CBS 121167]KAF2143450.1 hypothetical protein K452DRAFT_286275 [Aplosporella prunicola CBS 121167]
MASSSSKSAADTGFLGPDKLDDEFDISPGGSRHIETSGNADRVYTLSGSRTDPRKVPPLHDTFVPSDAYEVRPKWLVEEQRQQAARDNQLLHSLFEHQLEDWRVVLKEREQAALGAAATLGQQTWQLDLCANNVIRQILRRLKSGCVFVVRQRTNEMLACSHPMCPLTINKATALEGSDYVNLEPFDSWHNLETVDPIVVDDDEILVFKRPSHSSPDVRVIKPSTDPPSDNLFFCVDCLKNLYSRKSLTLANNPKLAPSTKDTSLSQQGSAALYTLTDTRTGHRLARHSTSAIETSPLSDRMLPHKRTGSEAGLDQLEDRQTHINQAFGTRGSDYSDPIFSSNSSTYGGSAFGQSDQTDGARDAMSILHTSELLLNTSGLSSPDHSLQQSETSSGWNRINEVTKNTSGLTPANYTSLPYRDTHDTEDEYDDTDDDSSPCPSPFLPPHSLPLSHDPILNKFLVSSWPLDVSSTTTNDQNTSTSTTKKKKRNPTTYHPDPSPIFPSIIGTVPPTSPTSLARRSTQITRIVLAANCSAARAARNETTLRKEDIVAYKKQQAGSATPSPLFSTTLGAPAAQAALGAQPASAAQPAPIGLKPGAPPSTRPLRLPVQYCHICNEPQGRRVLAECAGPRCLSGRVHSRCAAPGRASVPEGWLCAACSPDKTNVVRTPLPERVVVPVAEEEDEEVDVYGLGVVKKEDSEGEGNEGGGVGLGLGRGGVRMRPDGLNMPLDHRAVLPPELFADLLAMSWPTPFPPSTPPSCDLEESASTPYFLYEKASPSSSPSASTAVSDSSDATSSSSDTETEAPARSPYYHHNNVNNAPRTTASQLLPGSVCTACRRARKRCDRARPRCGACVEMERTCVYLPSG